MTGRVISSCLDTGCRRLTKYIANIWWYEVNKKKVALAKQTQVSWLELFHWVLAAQARGLGLTPASFQTNFHDVDTSLVPRLISSFHTRGRKSLDWAIVQLPNVTWSKCYHYHPITPYPPGRADQWSGTGCIRCRRWTNTPLPHLSSFQCEDNHH